MDGVSNKGTSVSETERQQHNQNIRKITTKKMDRNYAKKMERGAAMTSKNKDSSSNNQDSTSSNNEGRKQKVENRPQAKTSHHDQGPKSALLNTKDKGSPSKQPNRDHLSKDGHSHTGNANGNKGIGSGKKKNADRRVVGKLVNANLREAETAGVAKGNPVPTSPKKNAKSWASETIVKEVKEPTKNLIEQEKAVPAVPAAAVPAPVDMVDVKASPSHANSESDVKVEQGLSQMEKQLLKSMEDQEADLEKTYIFRLGKRSMKFPRALYYCRLCNYHIDTLSQCWIHIDQSRHERLAKAKESENFFKNLPKPSPAHARALTKLLEDVVQEHAMTGREMNQRKGVAQRVQSILQGVMPDCRVKLYGSSLSSFGFHDSDVNLDVDDPSEKQASKILMLVSQAIADRVDKDFTEFEADFEDKHPCVRFRDKKTEYLCELGTANQHAVQSSQLMVEYNECDARLRPLVMGLRYWARICGIDQQALGAMPAHTFVLLVIYFLQQCQPPILPVLQQNEKLKTENQRTLGELWVELLKFYLVGINIEELVISIRQREPVYRADLKIPNRRIAVEDPFANGKKTVAKSLTTSSVFKYIMDRFHDALKYFGIPPNKLSEMEAEERNAESESSSALNVTSGDGALTDKTGTSSGDDAVRVDSGGDGACGSDAMEEETEQSNKGQDEPQVQSVEEVVGTEGSSDDNPSADSRIEDNKITDGGDQLSIETRGEEENRTENPDADHPLIESREEQDRTETLDEKGRLEKPSAGNDGSEKPGVNEQLDDPEAEVGAMLAEVAITEAESEETKQVDSGADSKPSTESDKNAETDPEPMDEGDGGKVAIGEDTNGRDIVSDSTKSEQDQSESSPTEGQADPSTVIPAYSCPTAGSSKNDGSDMQQGDANSSGAAVDESPQIAEIDTQPKDEDSAALQTPAAEENVSSDQSDSRPTGPSESDSSPSVVQSEGGDTSSLSGADKVVNGTESEADVPCHSRLFNGIHMEEAEEEKEEDEEMDEDDQEVFVFTFDKEILTGGEEVQFVCTSCLKEGHINKYCPEDMLPPLKDLPPMDPAFLELSTVFCDQIMMRNHPNPVDVRNREQCVHDLEYYIRQYAFPEAQLSLFGSSVNGFGFRNSDLDICLTFRTAKTSKDVDVASVVEQLAMALKRNRSLYNIVPIPTAKVPIVKFVHRPTRLEGDISLYNTLAQCNTRLLYTYSQIDSRVKRLGYSMKFLAKVCDIGDASRGSLSSYAYTLLTIFFLQQREPPVLPVLQEMYSGDKQPVFEVDGCNAWFFSDLNQVTRVWRGYGQNKESVGALWLGMLRFYTEEFDFTKYVVSIRRKGPLTRFEKLWMTPQRGIALEDPFDLDHNLGGAASKKMAIYIVQVFRHARDVFGTPCRFFNGPRPNRDEIMRFFSDVDALTGGEAPPNDRGCRICGKIGHFVKDCPIKRRGQDRKESERRERESRERSMSNDNDALAGSPGAQRTMHLADSPLARGKHPMDSPQRPGMHPSDSSPQLKAKQLAEATNKRGRNVGDMPHAESSPNLRGKQLWESPNQRGIAIPGSSPQSSGKYQMGSPQQRGMGHLASSPQLRGKQLAESPSQSGVGHLESSPQVRGKQLAESPSQRGNHLAESPQQRGAMGHPESSPHLIKSKNAADSPNQRGKQASDPPHGGSTRQQEASPHPKGKHQELSHQRGVNLPESPQARGKGDKSVTGGAHPSESSPHPKEKRMEEKQKDSPKTKPSETKHKNASNDSGKAKKQSAKSNELSSKSKAASAQGAEKPAKNVARQLYPAKPIPVPVAKEEDTKNGAPATTAPPAGQKEKGAKKSSMYEQHSQQHQEQQLQALFQIIGKTPPRGSLSHGQAPTQGPMLRPPTVPSNAQTLDEIEQQLKTKERQQTGGPPKLPPGAKSLEQLEQQNRQDEFFKAREHQQQQHQQGHSPQNQQQHRQTGNQQQPYQKGSHQQQSQQHQVPPQQYHPQASQHQHPQDSSQFQADRAIRPPQRTRYGSGGQDGQYQGELLPQQQQQQHLQNQSHPIPIASQRRPSNERHLHQQQQQQQLSHQGWGSPLQTTPPSPHGMDHRHQAAFASPPRRQRWGSGGTSMPLGNIGPSPPHNLLQSPPGASTPPLLPQFGQSPFGPDMIVDPRQSSHQMRSPPHHNVSHRPMVAGNMTSIWGQQQEAGQNPWPQQINPDQNRQHQQQRDSWPQHVGQQNRNQQQQQVQHGEPQAALADSPRSPPMDPGSIIPAEAQRQFQNMFGQAQSNSQAFHYSPFGLNPNLPRSSHSSQSPVHNLQGQTLHQQQQQQQHLPHHHNQQQQQQQLHHHHPHHQYNQGEPQWQQQQELQQHIGPNMSTAMMTSSAVGGPIMSTTLSQQSSELPGSRNLPMPR